MALRRFPTSRVNESGLECGALAERATRPRRPRRGPQPAFARDRVVELLRRGDRRARRARCQQSDRARLTPTPLRARPGGEQQPRACARAPKINSRAATTLPRESWARPRQVRVTGAAPVPAVIQKQVAWGRPDLIAGGEAARGLCAPPLRHGPRRSRARSARGAHRGHARCAAELRGGVRSCDRREPRDVLAESGPGADSTLWTLPVLPNRWEASSARRSDRRAARGRGSRTSSGKSRRWTAPCSTTT